MFWEFFHIAAEEANKRAHFNPVYGRISPRRQIVFNGNFSRGIISVVVLWILGAGIILRLEAFTSLSIIGILANAGLILFSLVALTSLWRHPYLAYQILWRAGVLIAVCSAALFFSLLHSLPPEGEIVLRPELLISYIFLLPAALILFLCIGAGRRHIYLAIFADQFPDEFPETDLSEDGQAESNNKAD